MLLSLFDDLAKHSAEDVNLDTNRAVRGQTDGKSIVHIRFKRMERNAAHDHWQFSAHLRPADSPGDDDLDTLGPGLHRLLGPLPDRSPGVRPPLELLGDALGGQLRVQVGPADLFNIDVDPSISQVFQGVLQLVHFRPSRTDHQSWAGSLERHRQQLAGAFDIHLPYGRVGRLAVQPRVNEPADTLVLDEKLTEVALRGIPPASPAECYTCSETNWGYLLAHTLASLAARLPRRSQ